MHLATALQMTTAAFFSMTEAARGSITSLEEEEDSRSDFIHDDENHNEFSLHQTERTFSDNGIGVLAANPSPDNTKKNKKNHASSSIPDDSRDMHHQDLMANVETHTVVVNDNTTSEEPDRYLQFNGEPCTTTSDGTYSCIFNDYPLIGWVTFFGDCGGPSTFPEQCRRCGVSAPGGACSNCSICGSSSSPNPIAFSCASIYGSQAPDCTVQDCNGNFLGGGPACGTSENNQSTASPYADSSASSHAGSSAALLVALLTSSLSAAAVVSVGSVIVDCGV